MIRKIVLHDETVFGEAKREAARPIKRVAGIAIVANPYAGESRDDLSSLFDVGARVGERLMPDLVSRLGGPAESYGKAALVGALGDFEHGGACIHPKLGKPMREAIGGGKAVIPSNVKVGPSTARPAEPSVRSINKLAASVECSSERPASSISLASTVTSQ